MSIEVTITRTTSNLILVAELWTLLYEIVDCGLDICIRYRAGQKWQAEYLRILELSEEGLVVQDNISSDLTLLDDISEIDQFEIDVSVNNFIAHKIYEIER